ncbi:bifunctional 5,10-methylenetetrahydrofolate dehydrogenase/5,10-methenyltetrahydrofolate cyclohydrolase [Amycolatopsis sp. FDAARGOS 1241]|uniref:bifunctional 5,10-methylenetetrahydrofolate dehydrogenase/5,10-methenyltetrahydrofolate cyclohydrolase n=1 Tax=Amycolatopsis sp. FDAARGOS 1241 TaxID=2778070 RepID=UPI0019508407|nr:bifunctional 5,10-methylenetetrahydrofolate dehydrogenase/5,10-methenyltetrahydrofolate cyclohydrolase [Amycolatopsis sp. FDAARGOS 1241]QRP48849.1 bifunctional 5,10-methylenetetrahydrofolate dehydrogenase/5,10-methenyltetrahydrofolate cyclohydrolase [Amycolatopsis sp. FDAARGOS 1241]
MVAEERDAAKARGGRFGLATLSIGEDPAASAYLRRIDRTAEQLRVPHRSVRLAGSARAEEVLAAIRELNGDSSVSGILVLRPLPEHLDEADVFAALDPIKDVEAVHPENAGLLALGTPRYIPSTAAAVYHLLDSWLAEVGEEPSAFYRSSRIVVVGRSNNVGKPAVSLAYAKQSAVTSVDEWASVSGRLGSHTRRGDVLIVAAGVPGLIRAEHVRAGAVVVDVGINLVEGEDGRPGIVGDVAWDEVVGRARAITPVPGGVGPVTDVWLIRNTILAARKGMAT